jgi:hypothetical protein
VGEARDQEPGELQVDVLSAVAFEGPSHRMEGVAVNLDHSPLLAPQEVDLVAMQLHVHLGVGQAAAAAECEECLLELAAGEGRLARFSREQFPQCSGFPAGGSVQGGLDRVGRY